MARLLRCIYRKSTGEYLDNEQSWVVSLVVGNALMTRALLKHGEDIEIHEVIQGYLKKVKDGILVDDQVKLDAKTTRDAAPQPKTIEERVAAFEAKVKP